MSDSNDQNKQKEVELLQNSIDHLKSVHLKLEATAKAAKERREKAQQSALAAAPAKTSQADNKPAVLTQPIDSAPMEPTGEDLVEPTLAYDLAIRTIYLFSLSIRSVNG